MRSHHLTVLGVVAALVGGCTSADPAPAPEEAARTFIVDQHDETSLDVTLVAAGATVRLLALEVAPQVFDVTYDFGDPVIAFRFDKNTGAGDFMPSGAALDAVHLRLIDELAAELDKIVPPEDEGRWRVEDIAMRETAFMQIVPMGEELAPHSFASHQGWVNISCSCGNQYIGGGYYRTAGKGCGCTGGSGNGCKGRCGQGCGVTSTPRCSGNTSYTQDCARHDYGVGSFAAASDDYVGSSNNCSCSGVGTCY